MNALTYSSSGTKASSATTLPKDVFSIEIKNHELIKYAYEAYLANGRVNLAVTKTRGLIRGGGRKPWRQKGTGNARVGSSRNPIWRSGGVAFGPTGKENYYRQLNAKAKKLAIKQALSLKAKDSKILVIEDIKLKSPKTSELKKLLNKLPIDGQVLIVVTNIATELSLASNNLINVLLSKVSSINVFDVINADQIIITKDALKSLTDRLELKK
ncbi:MAG: 50S ribosomal protein L4 [Candidatus Saccharimonadales bacterium]